MHVQIIMYISPAAYKMSFLEHIFVPYHVFRESIISQRS